MNLEKLNEIKKELPQHVTLVAVSKTRTKAEIDEALSLAYDRTFATQ